MPAWVPQLNFIGLQRQVEVMDPIGEGSVKQRAAPVIGAALE
ncbi:hypothetical protein [Bradyrhizobium sp. CCBAU 51745]|nr:hypothetical protein [Bradyrhizobium sp. CCBAU 51745]